MPPNWEAGASAVHGVDLSATAPDFRRLGASEVLGRERHAAEVWPPRLQHSRSSKALHSQSLEELKPSASAKALRPIQSSASALGPLGDTTTARALREQAESLTALRTSQSRESQPAQLLRESASAGGTRPKLKTSTSAQLLPLQREGTERGSLRPLKTSTSAQLLPLQRESASAGGLRPLKTSTSAQVLQPLRESASAGSLRPLRTSASAEVLHSSPSLPKKSALSIREAAALLRSTAAALEEAPRTHCSPVNAEEFPAELAKVEEEIAAARAQADRFGEELEPSDSAAVKVDRTAHPDSAKRARLRQYKYVRRLEDPLPPLELPVVSEHRPLKKERLGAPDFPSETTKGTDLDAEELRRLVRRRANDTRREKARRKAATEAQEAQARQEHKFVEREAAAEERQVRAEEDRARHARQTALVLGLLVPCLAAAAAQRLGDLRPPVAQALASPSRKPTAQRALALIQAMAAAKVRIHQRRNGALALFETLKGWSVAGQFLRSTHRYHAQVRRVQQEWRASMARAVARRAAASALFVRLERSTVAAQIGAEERAARGQPQRKRKNEVKHTLTSAEKIELRMTAHAAREQLVASALAAKQRSLRARMEQYQRDIASWKRALQDWKDARAAHRIVRSAGAVGMPLPPVAPNVGLDEAEVAQLVARARGRTGVSLPAEKALASSPGAASVGALGTPSPTAHARGSRPSSRASRGTSCSPGHARTRRMKRAFTVADVFQEATRQTEELLGSPAVSSSPASSSSCPPRDHDPRLRAAILA